MFPVHCLVIFPDLWELKTWACSYYLLPVGGCLRTLFMASFDAQRFYILVQLQCQSLPLWPGWLRSAESRGRFAAIAPSVGGLALQWEERGLPGWASLD